MTSTPVAICVTVIIFEVILLEREIFVFVGKENESGVLSHKSTKTVAI